MKVQCDYCGEWFELSDGYTELVCKQFYEGSPLGVFPRNVCKRCHVISVAFKKVKEKRQRDV